MIMPTSDICPLCGGDKTSGHITFTADLDSGLVVVRKVPAKVCQQCGENWIEHETAKRLEKLVQDAQEKQAEVEIVQWHDAA